MLRFVGVAETVILSSLVVVAAGVAASVTRAVKLEVPVAVGVPLITPVEVFKVRPAGSEPVNDHEYGRVPPLAVSVAV
jgi:hypothetical protein